MVRVVALAALTAALLLVRAAGAQSQAASAAAGGVATNVAVDHPSSSTFPPLIGEELEDWKDPKIDSTLSLERGCEHVLEIALSGRGSNNFLSLALANDAPVFSAFDPRDVIVVFDHGAERRLIPLTPGVTRLDPGWWVQTILRFPDKAEFEHAESITVQVPIGFADAEDCVVQARLERRTPEPEPSSYIEFNEGELYLAGGVRFWASAGQRRLSSPIAPVFETGFAFFPSFHHGATISLLVEDYGSEGAAAIAPSPTGAERNFFAGGLFLGYSFRWPIKSWFTPSYNLSLGLYSLSLREDEDILGEKAYFMIRQSLSADARLGGSYPAGGFFMGLDLQHSFIPDGEFRTTSIAGHGLAGMLRVGIGGP